MPGNDDVTRAARQAIAWAKLRSSEEVTLDDLLLGILREVSRFGVAQIGPWAIDLSELDPTGEDGVPSGKAGPAYSADTVHLFEQAAVIAREDGARNVGLVHLLVAFSDKSAGLIARIMADHGINAREWRAALAKEDVGIRSPVEVSGGGNGNRGSTLQPDLLSVDTAAEYLGVHAQTVRNYIRSGRLPAYRLAGERSIRVLRSDLLALLEPVVTSDTKQPE